MNHLLSAVRVEYRKAFGKNSWLWITLAIGAFLAVLSSMSRAKLFSSTLELALVDWQRKDVGYSSVGAFALWMPIRPDDFAPGVFRMVWPILAALPYAWSWSVEKKAGIIEQSCVRSSKLDVIVAKWLAAFSVGFLAMAAPLATNLVCNACIEPAMPVWVSDELYIGVTWQAAFSSLFYTNPLAFCLLWTLVAGVIGGLWSTFVSALSMCLGSFLPSMAISYVSLHVLAFVGEQLQLVFQVSSDSALSSLLSLDIFSTISVRSQTGSGEALLVTATLLLAFSVVVPSMISKRDLL